MMPSCDQTGVPGLLGFAHFHSSTTSGSASWMSLRILPRVFPRQSPSSAILFEMSWLAPDCFMFSSWLQTQDAVEISLLQAIQACRDVAGPRDDVEPEPRLDGHVPSPDPVNIRGGRGPAVA